MEVTVSSDLPECLSEAFRMRIHNRSVPVIVQVQTVTVTEQIGALIRLYAVYLPALLLQSQGHTFAGLPKPVTATSSLKKNNIQRTHNRPEHAPASLKVCRKNTALSIVVKVTCIVCCSLPH